MSEAAVGAVGALVSATQLTSQYDSPREFVPVAARQTASFASMLIGAVLLNIDLIENRNRLQKLLEERQEKPSAATPSRKDSGVEASVTLMNSDRALGLAVVGVW